MYSSKDREDLDKLEELGSLQNEVNAVRLRDKLGRQKFHEDMKKVFEPVIDTSKNTCEDITKTMMLTCKENNKTIENLNEKRLETMNDRGILAYYLMSLYPKITNLENKSHFKLVEDPNSNRIKDLFLIETLPITPYKNLLTFRVTDK